MIRLVVLLLVVSANLNAQDYPQFAVNNVDDALKKHADVIIRKLDMSFTVISSQKAIKHVYQVKTILNKNAETEAVLVIPYDDFRKIKKFMAVVLDANGNKVDKVKSSDIIDYSGGGSTVDDSRMKIVDLSRAKYPFTILLEYEVEFNTIFYTPTFAPQHNSRTSTEEASFTLTFPPTTPIRYKYANISEPEIKNNSYKWKVENLTAHKTKSYSPEKSTYLPIVRTSPKSFKLGESSGSLASWNGFGKWYDELSEGRDELSEADKAEVLNITKGISSDYEKARLIYNRLQEKTRYVSVQLGIGGYQTMPAKKVEDVGWGDCKALTNYTKAMLKAVNIDSYPALVRSGSNAASIMEDFSSNQFNHVILCVPMATDTVWLECTSRAMPFNFLGDFTDDRKVLLITKGGGKLVSTPSYSYTDSQQKRVIEVWIDKNNLGKASVTTEYTGLQFDNVLGYVDKSKDKLKKAWYRKIDIPNYTIEDISFTYKNDDTKATQKLELSLRDYTTKSGERYFLKPNLMNRYSSYPKKDETRTEEVVTGYAYSDVDSIVYHLPDGYYFEFLPKDISFSSDFGKYEASFKANEKGFTYIRKIERYKGTYPKESYNDLVNFLKKVKKSDNVKVVLNAST